MPDTAQGNRERVARRPLEFGVHILGDVFVHLAHKPQRHMHVLRRHPACTRDLSPQTRKAQAQLFGQRERDEEPDHAAVPSVGSGNTVRTPV